MQNEYKISPIVINGLRLSAVIIDDHYKIKHSDSINDPLILRLIKTLDGRIELPEDKDGKFSYFATMIDLDDKRYRIIWLLEDGAIYVGVINVYRDKRRK